MSPENVGVFRSPVADLDEVIPESQKKTEEEIISCCFTMFLYRHPLENDLNTRLTLRLMPQERIKRNKIDEKGAAEGG